MTAAKNSDQNAPQAGAGKGNDRQGHGSCKGASKKSAPPSCTSAIFLY